MQPFHPLFLERTHSQIDQPHIGQATGDQKPTQPLWLTQMAFVHLKATAFLVREERLNMCAFLVELHRRIQIAHIGDQIDRLKTLLLPECQYSNRAVLFKRHPGWCDRQKFSRRRSDFSGVETNPTGSDHNVGGSPTDIRPAQSTQVSLQFDTVKLTIAGDRSPPHPWA